jgi:hypothetical protein
LIKFALLLFAHNYEDGKVAIYSKFYLAYSSEGKQLVCSLMLVIMRMAR